SNGTLHGDVQDALKLSRIRDHLALVATFLKQILWMRFLKVSRADLAAGNMRCDRQHRSIAAMSIEKAVNQVQVAGAATPRAGGELAGELRLRAGRKRAGLLVAHMDPFNFVVQP